MIDISWLHFLILVFAAFSINYLIINEITAYFSARSYLIKWVLCLLFSTVVVLVNNYVPYSFVFILIFAVAGGVEFTSTFVSLMKKKREFNHKKEEEYKKILDITDEVFEYYQGQIAALRNNENESIVNPKKDVQPSTVNESMVKTEKTQVKPPTKINVSTRDTKIINSDRMYGQQEFLKETQGQKITLSPYLRSNLNNSKTPEK